ARAIFRIGRRRGALPCVGGLCSKQGLIGEPKERRGTFVSIQAAIDDVSTLASEAEFSRLQTAWEVIRAGLRRDCGARTFDGWLRPIALGSFDSDSASLRLELPSQFMADWVQTHFAERLALAWRAACPAVRHVQIGVGPAAPRTAAVVEIPAPAEEPAEVKQG